ncbi:uracil phosphoribosyltransferase [Fulvivirgaceae bacterium BMA10]|uniref:Uracil phosphoribosyltransferase n=1 Tax=Splendidivirga corallicola TaxID=3051826 RepID=A0ABT8KII3_9BACT|nr:uracil phosphoribosyltransferase [Fulvivirgaceae bacterium BMA10]
MEQSKLNTNIFILNHVNSIANHFLAEIRDTGIQDDRLRFRKNLERIGQLLAYELSKTFSFGNKTVNTPLDSCQVDLIEEQPVLVPVLRAGIPFYNGVLSYFDCADSGFIGAYRQEETEDGELEIAMDYIATPSIEDKRLVVIDTMLATGKSLVKSLNGLLKYGSPKHVDVLAVIAAPEGVEYLNKHLSINSSIWLGALDEKLNSKFYIMPGLGDAGDLAFGTKL